MIKWLIIAGIVVGSSAHASAQNIDVGKTEYQSSCGSCHGIGGKGDGPVSKELKTPPADLTILTKNNNGVFPYDMVYQRSTDEIQPSPVTARAKCQCGATDSVHRKHLGSNNVS